MKRRVFLGVGVAMLCGGLVGARPFQPMMQAGDGGALSVKAPGSRSFDDAQPGQAYPYGSQLKTGGNGGGMLVLSEGNQVELAADTMCSIGEATMDASRKVLSLDIGRVEVMLEEGFGANNSLQVMTKVAAVEALGGTFSVEAMSENNMDVAVIEVESGQVKVSGPHFALSVLDAGDRLTVSTAKDNSYTLLETVKGSFSVEVKDADGNPKSVETEEGSVIKIWRRTSESGKTLIVTILITAPDGSLQEAITYTEDIPDGEGRTSEGGEPTGDVTTTTVPPGELLLLTTTPTTTTTTSTTFPSPTPIGRR